MGGVRSVGPSVVVVVVFFFFFFRFPITNFSISADSVRLFLYTEFFLQSIIMQIMMIIIVIIIIIVTCKECQM